MITITNEQRNEIINLVISLGTVETTVDLREATDALVSTSIRLDEIKSFEDLVDAAYIMAEINDEALIGLQS